MLAYWGREAWLHPVCMTQQDRLASMAAWLSSTGISRHSLLPHIPSICLSAVNSSPHPGTELINFFKEHLNQTTPLFWEGGNWKVK